MHRLPTARFAAPCIAATVAILPMALPTSVATPPGDAPIERCSSPLPLLAIPDANTTGIADAILIEGDGRTVASITVSLAILHSYVGDLEVRLEHVESGRSILLLDRPGLPGIEPDFGCPENNVNVLFDDTAPAAAEDACATTAPAIAGTLRPSQPLTTFIGIPIDGTWRLTTRDLASQNAGALQNWCLRITPAAPGIGESWVIR